MTSVVLMLALAQNPALTGERSLVSKCEVSADPEYGFTREKPIKVGGTPVYGPRRQRQFLQALVGPAGQPIAFKRRGSLAPDADNIILDLYEVTYPGVEKPIELYLDLYRWDPPKAPRGFLCGTPIGLEPPPPDPMEARRKLVDAALAWTGGDIPPIPLLPGSPARGMAFDPFRLIVLAARDAAARGRALTPEEAAAIQTPALLVVANPVECGGQAVAPERVTLIGYVDSQERPAQPVGALLKGDALQKLLPGVALAPGAAGAAFAAGPPIRGFVSIKYEGTSCGDPARLPLTPGQPEKIVDMRPAWPAGMPLPQPGQTIEVRLRATIGVDGVPADLQPLSPVSPFMVPAVEAVRQWRYRPLTINGEPYFVPVTMNVVVTFSRK